MTSAVEHLSNLIRIPSVSAMPNRAITNYAGTVLTAHGWTVREDVYTDQSGIEKVNLIAAAPGEDIGARMVDLAFLCHTDTVPYSEDWLEALQPIRRGSMLHGCGACDVKGFLACLLTAAEGKDAPWIDGLRIVLTADEEIGCVGSKRLIATDSMTPRRIVVGEPTSLRAARAGKGYCLARVTIDGREAHSALPEQGISAIYGAAHLVSALEELSFQLAEERHEFFEPAFTTLNVGTIQGGSAKNIIPGRAELLLEWRPIPGFSGGSHPNRDTHAAGKAAGAISRHAWFVGGSQGANGIRDYRQQYIGQIIGALDRPAVHFDCICFGSKRLVSHSRRRGRVWARRYAISA